MSKVEDFIKNGGYEVTKSGTNPFNNIEMEGTARDPEEDNVGEICLSHSAVHSNDATIFDLGYFVVEPAAGKYEPTNPRLWCKEIL